MLLVKRVNPVHRRDEMNSIDILNELNKIIVPGELVCLSCYNADNIPVYDSPTRKAKKTHEIDNHSTILVLSSLMSLDPSITYDRQTFFGISSDAHGRTITGWFDVFVCQENITKILKVSTWMTSA